MSIHRRNGSFTQGNRINSFISISILYFISISQVTTENVQEFAVTCDPLFASGTSLLCAPPIGPSITNCDQRSVPGTTASYACRNPQGNILRGFLNCTEDGIWMSTLRFANNSLCNLEASIINVQQPDIAVATAIPGFTTPAPNFNLLQQDISSLTDYQKMALQLHNTFRTNHGVSSVGMTPLMNEAAQDMADFIASGKSVGIESTRKLALLNVTLNIEMNWYLQPASPNNLQAVSNAIQSWYATGFSDYDWRDVGNNLDKSEALAFSRIIWKANKLIGVGVINFNSVTFVTCIYSPGRHVSSTDPTNEFRENVQPIHMG